MRRFAVKGGKALSTLAKVEASTGKSKIYRLVSSPSVLNNTFSV